MLLLRPSYIFNEQINTIFIYSKESHDKLLSSSFSESTKDPQVHSAEESEKSDSLTNPSTALKGIRLNSPLQSPASMAASQRSWRAPRGLSLSNVGKELGMTGI